jgi:Anaphase-promoting complex subunit 11 RING-H2 finger
MKSAVSVAFNSMELVLPANSQAMTVPSVRASYPLARLEISLTPTVIGKCGHSFHMHCLLTWIQQDSSKGLCPMCRQKFEWKQGDGPNENQTMPT